MSKQVFIVAGEVSGDHHAGGLARELKRLLPDVRLKGVGGDEMRAAGVETVVDIRELAVVGLVEVLRQYRRLARIRDRIAAQVVMERPDLLILVDYPDFNLGIAREAKRAGIKVLFYVSPQVWAWRPRRVKKIARRIDHMAVLFPFETAIYEAEGVPVTFVGHPLADEVRIDYTPEEARTRLGVPAGSPVIGLLPGSRRGEIERHMRVLLDAAQLLRRHYPEARFLLPRARTIDPQLMAPFLEGRDLPLQVTDGNARTVMRACDALVTASGTATLEVGLVGTPMVIIYRLAPLTYRLLKRMIRVPWLGLCNIISGAEVAKELIQDAATPEAIAAEVTHLIDDHEYRAGVIARLGEIRARLGTEGASEKVARAALGLMGEYGGEDGGDDARP